MTNARTPKSREIWETDGPYGPELTLWNGAVWVWPENGRWCYEQRRTLIGDGPVAYSAEHVDSLRSEVLAAEKLYEDAVERAEAVESERDDLQARNDRQKRGLHQLSDALLKAEERAAQSRSNLDRAEKAAKDRDEAIARAEAAEASLTQWKRATRLCQESRGRLWQARGVAIARAADAEVALADAEATLKAEQENWLAGDLPTITEREPWRVLRAAAAIVHAEGFFMHVPPAELNVLADRLEREHAGGTKRDQLIEKAARAICASDGELEWDRHGDGARASYLDNARALADAGLLREVEE